MIRLDYDVKTGEGEILFHKGKLYPVKAEEPSKNPGKVILVIDSEIPQKEVLIETDIE